VLQLNSVDAEYRSYLNDLLRAGLLIASGVPGVYGLGGLFEEIVDRFDGYVTRTGARFHSEVMRFPPVLSRRSYQQTDHMETFPHLMGSVHGFMGGEDDSIRLVERKALGQDWTAELRPTDIMMTPAACYPLYPTATGVLPDSGRTVDVRGFVFRHEPSIDPARMQIFRMREYVRLGTPQQALEHRDYWLARGEEMLRTLKLDVRAVVATDPFFGRVRRVMAATQREQTLKYELVVPVASPAHPTAVASCNYHVDHFGQRFDIRTGDGKYAHTSCIGFGLERMALALFKAHGFDPSTWPMTVREALAL
jgi:seryl-tRNA synthetase